MSLFIDSMVVLLSGSALLLRLAVTDVSLGDATASIHISS